MVIVWVTVPASATSKSPVITGVSNFTSTVDHEHTPEVSAVKACPLAVGTTPGNVIV